MESSESRRIFALSKTTSTNTNKIHNIMATKYQAADAISETKQKLIAVCETIKLAELLSDTYAYCDTMNEKLTIFYGLKGKELKTFKGWIEEGRCVTKGEKAFAFWTKPKVGTKNVDVPAATATAAATTEKVDYKFYHVCYLFSKEQTEQK